VKLQLTPTQIGDFTLKVGAKSALPDPLEGLRRDVSRTLSTFRTEGHDPFTRKDVAAVLVGMGYDAQWVEKDAQAYAAITNVLSAQARPATDATGAVIRGSYTQGGVAPAPSANNATTPAPAPSSIPAPTVDEEIVLDVVLVPGLSLADIGFGGNAMVQAKVVTEAADLYEQDLGLRRLAAAKSPCFGVGFDETDASCQGCPLATRCARQSLSFFGSVAADLDAATERTITTAVESERRRLAEQKARDAEKRRQEAAAAAARANPTPVNMPAPPPSPAPAPSGPAPSGPMSLEKAQAALGVKYPGQNLSALALPFEGICSMCKLKIQKGTFGVHLNGTGMVHIDCALK
jgi:hypothetical protein